MAEYYSFTMAGHKVDLEKFPVNEKLDIAGFNTFDFTDLIVDCCTELLKKLPEFDVIVTPEAKSIPIAFEMSRQSGKPYIVLRKGVKIYMSNPICVTVNSITTEAEQKLYLGETEAKRIVGKKVLIVDDVISTGESLAAVRNVVSQVGGNEVAACALLAEGDAAERKDIYFLEKLPLFFKD